MWKTSAAWMRPFIVMTDVMVVVGLAISPQIAKPFLESSVHGSRITSNSTASTMTGDEVGLLHPVQIAFFILGGLDFIMVIVCMSICVWSSVRGGHGVGQCFRHVDDDDDVQLIPDNNEELSNAEDKVKPCSRQGCVLLTLIFLLLIVYGGVYNVLFIYLLYTYLNEYLGWSVAASTLLASACPVMSAVFGAIVAVASHWVSPTGLTIFNLVTWLTSSILLFVAQLGIDAFTVISVIISSATASNMYPTTVCLVDETMNVIAPVMALIISSCGASSIIFGPVTGALLHKFGALTFPSVQFALTLIAIALFVIYSVLTRVMTRVKSTGVRTVGEVSE